MGKIVSRRRILPLFPFGDVRLGVLFLEDQPGLLGLAGIGGARLVLLLADELEVDRAAVQLERVHEAGLEVAAVLLGELLLAVAENLDAERTVARLQRVVGAEAFATHGRRR